MNRRISVTNPAIQSAPLFQQTYAPAGQVASIVTARNNTTFDTTGLTYDGLDRLSVTTYPDSSTQTLTYDDDSNILTRETRKGDTIIFTYDTLNRLSTKTPPSSPVVSYAYDLAGHPIGISDTSSAITAAVPPSGTTVQYATSTSYDQLNRPIGTSWSPAPAQTPPTAGSVTFDFTYDGSNRRVSQTTTDTSWWSAPSSATSVSYTANNLDQYSAVGATTPAYDGNGNLTADGTFTYGYDAESRLTSASATGLSASYAYDAQGRRKSKTVNGTTTILVQDPRSCALLDYAGSSGAIQDWYAFGSGPNDALAQMNVAGSTRATYVPDIQGSIVASLDASSGTLTKTGYQPFGESGTTSGTFRYTGARIDAETNGLYDFRARMYAPVLGRFLQVDPSGFQGGSNLYAYVGNDPLNATDPLGLDCVSAGGTTTCSTSAYNVNFPTPQGWQDFTSSSTNYHFYSTPANVDSANPAAVQQWVANNPTPGSPSPATPQGTLNDATPVLGGVSPINISPVLSYTTTNQANGSPVVLNVTLPGHPLFPGVVVREVDQTSGGTVINNYGEGTSALQSPSTFEGEELGPDINGVWTGQVPSSSQVSQPSPK